MAIGDHQSDQAGFAHRAWVRALHQEVKDIFQSAGLSVPRPAIRLHTSQATWGRWDPVTQTISLSVELVSSCPWRVVVEVLKHEIAHQIVDTLHPGIDEVPHGDAFYAACERLRVEPWARHARTGVPLERLRETADWRVSQGVGETAKLARRLDKLLALADSSNEHEAVLAMERARQMQDRLRASDIQAPIETEFVSLEVGVGRQRHTPYEGQIASILMSHFHVDIVFATRFCAATCQVEAIVDLLGRPHDVLFAEHVHAFLHKRAASLWHQHRAETGARGLRARNSYIRGLLAGFHAKLNDQQSVSHEKKKGTAGALVKAEEANRKRFVRRRYPRLASRTSSGRLDRDAFVAGRQEGGKLELRRPVEAPRPSLALLPSKGGAPR